MSCHVSASLPQICHDKSASLPQICHDKSASLPQICHDKSASLPQICHDKSASLQQDNESFEVTMKRTCSKFATSVPCKLIANYSKNRVRNTTRDRTRDLPVPKRRR
ncbi:hypothetical protein AVEN_248745-1 [Araneus ventricosus]|uniref:Uncharacterized protein n=1 Tax=Araneus ventricosus TaxID=182803 RepID=A0A4Y2PFL8_ARAVE|nr:hypothetical protein AVEN_248745-1 [Araneus ventricosus]